VPPFPLISVKEVFYLGKISRENLNGKRVSALPDPRAKTGALKGSRRTRSKAYFKLFTGAFCMKEGN
jgi:hypothetical protein